MFVISPKLQYIIPSKQKPVTAIFIVNMHSLKSTLASHLRNDVFLTISRKGACYVHNVSSNYNYFND